MKGVFRYPYFDKGEVWNKGVLVLANAMGIERWNIGCLRRLKALFYIYGCDFYYMDLEEGKRNYNGIADFMFTSNPELIAHSDQLEFKLIQHAWYPARATPDNFLIPVSTSRKYDVGIFKRAGWEKNWEMLIEQDDPFVDQKVFVHCPWRPDWYNERERAIFYRVMKMCKDRGYTLDAKAYDTPHALQPLYDQCRNVLLFSTTESDSRMMVEAYLRQCTLHVWSGTRHLIPNFVVDRMHVFDTFEAIDMNIDKDSEPPSLNGDVLKRIIGPEASMNVIRHHYPGKVESTFWRPLSSHEVFYHTCREGDESKLLSEVAHHGINR